MRSTPMSFLLYVMTLTTGLIDAVSFLALGSIFTANMTGNIVFLGFSLGGAGGPAPGRSIIALAGFVAGAIVGGRIARHSVQATQRTWLLRAGGAEAVSLVVATFAAAAYDAAVEGPRAALFALIAFTAFAMGIRTATVMRVKDPDLKTTVLTLTIASIAADSMLAGGTNIRVGRRLVSVATLLLGAALGAWLLHAGGVLAAIVASWVLLLAGLGVFAKSAARREPVLSA